MKSAIVSNDTSLGTKADLVLSPGANMRFDVDEIVDQFGSLTSLEQDLLTLAVSVFSCDLGFAREERENFVRAIDLTVPVVNYQGFERLKPSLIYILWTLTHDSWKLTFVQAQGEPEGKAKWPEKSGRTLLFSGGLDSFAGAADFLNNPGPEKLLLASHLTANRVTRESQDSLFEYLTKKYGSLNRVRLKTRLQNTDKFSFPTDDNREETQRARSFLFLALGAIASRRSGFSEIVALAENGQMAIHLPLTAARIGGFSTHTAHPNFISLSEKYFSELMQFKFTITNPYLYATKAEVVKGLVANHADGIPLSSSCWRGVRVTDAKIRHCGQCVPCLVRRISLEANGLELPEFARDLLREDVSKLRADDDGKRNLVDLAEFAYRFTHESDAQILDSYADLVSPHIDFDKAVGMYRRFATEANAILQKYPAAAKVLTKTALPAKQAPKTTPKKPKTGGT
ncbi:7-cyano-7-deazaguanine synthase [Candidatus Obscuribacterales bacterium]|nr:7-cyano-7-deazaguanine synthase [Candidatus Obscuribacterales bacterium]